jgi:LPXTG-motif cell wall-anchored protein
VSPPARVFSPASGDGSSRLGLAGGAGALVIALLAGTFFVRRRRAS